MRGRETLRGKGRFRAATTRSSRSYQTMEFSTIRDLSGKYERKGKEISQGT